MAHAHYAISQTTFAVRQSAPLKHDVSNKIFRLGMVDFCDAGRFANKFGAGSFVEAFSLTELRQKSRMCENVVDSCFTNNTDLKFAECKE